MIAVAATAYGSIDSRQQRDDCVRHLAQGWSVCSTPADEFSSPSALEAGDPDWIPAAVPGTVGGALRVAGGLDWDHPPPLDDQDHWFRLALQRPSGPYQSAVLELDGVATLGRVWLENEHLGDTENMFVRHSLDLTSALARSESKTPWLYICCRSMTRALAQPRPRARWRTRLVSHRSLRYLRTSLLGRMPGIGPEIPVVGPWRDVRLRTDSPLAVERLRIVPDVVAGLGMVRVSGRCRVPGELRDTLRAFLDVGQVTSTLDLQPAEEGLAFSGTLEIDRPRLWWPHTHGDPHRYGATLRLETDNQEHRVALAPIGFRSIEIDEPGGAFDVQVNGVKVFCRGACWTPADFLGQAPSSNELRRALESVRQAGMNMLRVPGTTVYEQDAFYELCDEMGILLWQDFMFANMDYPFEDEAFRATVREEINFQLTRFGHRPCLAVLCGGSEVQQQAAMLGLPEALWRVRWLQDDLASLCRQHRPDVIYIPGSPSAAEGLPFHLEAGPSHYFGVGAYRRPLSDAWTSEPRFASECLAFGVPPCTSSSDGAGTNALTLLQRTPRDAGAAWDFVDVAEHYAEELFGTSMTELRETQLNRHMSWCRAAAGEVMARTQAIWRRPESACGGALVWLLRDFWPCAGWGVMASDGTPKAGWFYLKRAWQPRTLLFLNRGLDGLRVLAVNDKPVAMEGRVSVRLARFDGIVVARGDMPVQVAPHAMAEIRVEDVLGSFVDSGYAYRFGAPGFDVVQATFEGTDTELSAIHVREGAFPTPVDMEQVSAELQSTDRGFELRLGATGFLHTVALETPGLQPDDNYFHVLPDQPRIVALRDLDDGIAHACRISALNARGAIEVPVGTTSSESHANLRPAGP